MSTGADKEYTICMNISEGKLVFEALAELPFKYVYDLIGKLNSQANRGAMTRAGASVRHTHTFSPEELELTIRALGAMPFNRVHALVSNLNDQIREQLDGCHLSEDLRAHDRAQDHQQKTA